MKKILLILFLFNILCDYTNGQFVRIWEKSEALNNLPSWFSTSGTRERGIAYSNFSGIPKLYVISNLADPTVIILDAMSGDSIGTLNTDGIEGGLLLISDISSYPNNYWPYPSGLYACNQTDDATTSHFKIYKWESDTSVPQILFEDSLSDFRIGDHLNLDMDLQNQHYITVSSNNNKIIDYCSVTGNPPLIRKEITLSDGITGANASADYNWVYPFDLVGSYVVNSDGALPKFYDTLGVFHSISDSSIVSSSSNSIKYFANGTLCCDLPFYTTYQYDGNNAAVILSQGPPWETLWGETPSLGNNPNPEHYGDVEYVWLNYYTLYIFVLSGNNGIGAYHAQGLATPVELITFDGKIENGDVTLHWETATEINNYGFEIERKYKSGNEEVFTNWDKVGFVAGSGTTTERRNYSFKDENIPERFINYRIKQIDFDGSFYYSEILELEYSPITEFYLLQNFPNPFNPTTTIKFALPVESKVKINVYNSLGQLVQTLLDKEMESGYHEINFNASQLVSGVYLYQLQAGEYVSVKKMLLIK
jgi:hypothetical protein